MGAIAFGTRTLWKACAIPTKIKIKGNPGRKFSRLKGPGNPMLRPSYTVIFYRNHLSSNPRQLTAASATRMFHLSSCVVTSIANSTTHAMG
jgi:hypothetical protein